jgi:hypothetical protein
VLDAIQIMSGFSHIRSELRTNCRLTKSLDELALWFTFSDSVLYVHDLEEHINSMALAVCQSAKENIWVFRLREGSPGEQLLKQTIIKNKLAPNKYLNAEYRSRGYIPFRLLK